MTTVRELLAKLVSLDPETTVTLVIADEHSEMVCSGEITVDTAELASNNEIMLTGSDDS